MPTVRVTYVEFDGTEHEVHLSSGTSLMQGAVSHMVPGIEGDCGGRCACATCHVYVKDEWQTRFQKANELETAILDFAYDVADSSRLACQIRVDESHDGIIVHLPERQY